MGKKKYINVERKIQSEGYCSQDSFSFCNKTEAYNFIFKDFDQNQKELEAKGYFCLDLIRNQTKNVSVCAANFMNNASFHIIDIRWILKEYTEVEKCGDTADAKKKEEVNTIVSKLQEMRSTELGELNKKVEPEPGINVMDKSEASINERNVSKRISVEVPSGHLVADIDNPDNESGIFVYLQKKNGKSICMAYCRYDEDDHKLEMQVCKNDSEEDYVIKTVPEMIEDKIDVHITDPNGNEQILNMNCSEVENKWILVTFKETGDIDQITFPGDEAACFRSAFAVVKSGNPAPAVVYNGMEKTQVCF